MIMLHFAKLLFFIVSDLLLPTRLIRPYAAVRKMFYEEKNHWKVGRIHIMVSNPLKRSNKFKLFTPRSLTFMKSRLTPKNTYEILQNIEQKTHVVFAYAVLHQILESRWLSCMDLFSVPIVPWIYGNRYVPGCDICRKMVKNATARALNSGHWPKLNMTLTIDAVADLCPDLCLSGGEKKLQLIWNERDLRQQIVNFVFCPLHFSRFQFHNWKEGALGDTRGVILCCYLGFRECFNIYILRVTGKGDYRWSKIT